MAFIKRTWLLYTGTVQAFWADFNDLNRHFVDFVVKIITIKNYVDQVHFSIRSVLFYNLINRWGKQNYTHLSLYKLIDQLLICIWLTYFFYSIKFFNEVYSINGLDQQNGFKTRSKMLGLLFEKKMSFFVEISM